MKKFIIGVIVGSIGIMPVSAVAMDVLFNKIIVKVNGNSINADNVLINGRTYVPLRAISENLNKDVAWDEKTSTASINDKDYKDKTAEVGYSRLKPASIGTKLNTIIDSSTKANITVKEIIRGDKALDIILNTYSENDKPDKGYEYILAKIEFELVDSSNQYTIGSSLFHIISENGKEYSNASLGFDPEPQIYAKLYKGAKNEGYVVYQVELTDTKPVITFGRDYKGNGGIWFKAYQD